MPVGSNGVPVVTVSQVNRVVGMLIKGDRRLANVAVRGEISDFTRHSKTGHLYFTLKDDQTRLKAVMFAGSASRLAFDPKNGDTVICRGSVTVYEPSGVYQIVCADIEAYGEGEQAAALEMLKKRLYAEGVFSRKRPIPARPKKIAVVTAPGGAALQDIINIISRRFPIATLVVVPALVQGAGAARSVADGIARAQSTGADVIIFGRGGGSAEDLSAFNTEIAARAVFASGIPTISAVGHETDTTLVDYAADLRAPTPSAAAELAVPDISEIYDELSGFAGFAKDCVLRRIAERERELSARAGIIGALSPRGLIKSREQRLENLCEALSRGVRSRIDAAERTLMKNAEVIGALNPLGVLARGYSVTCSGGSVVTDAARLRAGDVIDVRLARGRVSARVTKTEEGAEDGI